LYEAADNGGLSAKTVLIYVVFYFLIEYLSGDLPALEAVLTSSPYLT
jgi:high-affinity Fe2+/Pb2+ permease